VCSCTRIALLHCPVLALALESPGPLILNNPRVSPRALQLVLQSLDATLWRHQVCVMGVPLGPGDALPPTYDDFCADAIRGCEDFAVEHLHALHWLGLLDMHAVNTEQPPVPEDYAAVARFAEDLASDANDLLSAGMPFATVFFNKYDAFDDTYDKAEFLAAMALVSGRGGIGEHLATRAVEARCAEDSRIGVREARIFMEDSRWAYPRKARLLLLGGFPAFATAALVFSSICGAPGGDRVGAWNAIRTCYHSGAVALPVEEGLHGTLAQMVGMQAMLNSPVWSPAPPGAPHLETPDTSIGQGVLRQVFMHQGCAHGHLPDYTPTYSITSSLFLDERAVAGRPSEGRCVALNGFKLRATPSQLSVSVVPEGPLTHPVAASVMVHFMFQPDSGLLPVAMPRLAFVRPVSLHQPCVVPFVGGPVQDVTCLTYVFEDRSSTPHISTDDGAYVTSWP
jgi:hypothetical protein